MNAEDWRDASSHQSARRRRPARRGSSYQRPGPEGLDGYRSLALAGIGVLLVIVVFLAALVISRGSDDVAVPSVIGLRTDSAVEALEAVGLESMTEPVLRDDVDPGTVVSQDPPAESLVSEGSSVRLLVAAGQHSPGQVEVPDVVGRLQGDALAAIASAGLAGQTQPVTSEAAPVGTVVAQDPPAGMIVAPGSPVRLDIAQEQEQEINVIAWILDLAPGAPTGPPEFKAYQALLDRDCDTLRRDLVTDGTDVGTLDPNARALYLAAADACSAALNGRPELWAAAQDALPTLNPVSCLDVAAYNLLVDLLDTHTHNPGGSYQVTTGPSTEYAPCPTMTVLEPSRGPRNAVVRIVGTNLDGVQEVRVVYWNRDGQDDDDPATNATPQNGTWELTLEAEEDIISACIYVVAATGWNASGLWFDIETLETASPPPTSESPTIPLDRCPPESQE